MRDKPTSEENLLATLDQLIDYVSDDIFTGFLEHKGMAVQAPGYLLLRLICHPILIAQGTKARRNANNKLITDLGLVSTDKDGKKHLIYETEDFFRTCVNKSDKIAKILEQVRSNRWLFGLHVGRLLWLHYSEYPAGNKPELTTEFFFTKLLPITSEFMSFRAELDEDRPFKKLYPQFMASLMQADDPDIDPKFSGLANATDIVRVNQYLLPYLMKVIDHIHSRNFDKPKKTAILDSLLGAAENFFAGNLVAMINRLGVFADLAELKDANLDHEAKDLGMFVREAIVRYTASYKATESDNKQLNLEDLKIFPLAFDQISRTVDFETITAKLMSGRLDLPKNLAFPSGSDTPKTSTVRASPPADDSVPPVAPSSTTDPTSPPPDDATTSSPSPGNSSAYPSAESASDSASLLDADASSSQLNGASQQPSTSFFGGVLNYGAGLVRTVGNGFGYGASMVQDGAHYVWQNGRRDLGQTAWNYGVSPVASVMDASANLVFGDRSLETALEEIICSLAQPGLHRTQTFTQVRNAGKILQKIDSTTLKNPSIFRLFIRRAQEIRQIVGFLEDSPVGSRIWKYALSSHLRTIHPALASLSPDGMLTLCKKGADLLSILKANNQLLNCDDLAMIISRFLDNVEHQKTHHPNGKPADPIHRAALSLFSEPDTYNFLVAHAPLLKTVLDTFLSQSNDNDQNIIRKACARMLHQITTDTTDTQALSDADTEAGAKKVQAIAEIGTNLCTRLTSTPSVVHADSLADCVNSLQQALQTDGATFSTALGELGKTDKPYQLFHQHLDLLTILCNETIAQSTAPQASTREMLVNTLSPILPDRLQDQKSQLAVRLQEVGAMMRSVLRTLQDKPLDNEDCKKLFTTYAHSGYDISSLQSSPDLYQTLLKNQPLLTVVCKKLAQHEEAIMNAKKRNIHPNPVYFSDLIIDALPFLRDEYGIGAEDIRKAYLPLLPSLTNNLTAGNCPSLHSELPTFLADLLSPPTQKILGDPNYFTDINADSIKTRIMPWLNSLVAKIVKMKDPLHSGQSARQLVQIGEDFFSQDFVGLANTFNHLCQITDVGKGSPAIKESDAKQATEFIRKVLLSKFSELNADGTYTLSNKQIRPAELDYCWKLLGVSDIVSGYLTGKTKEKPGQEYPAPVAKAPAPKEKGFWAQTKSWALFIYTRYIYAAMESLVSWGAAAITAIIYFPVIVYSYLLSAKRWAYGLFKGLNHWFYDTSENKPPRVGEPSTPPVLPHDSDKKRTGSHSPVPSANLHKSPGNHVKTAASNEKAPALNKTADDKKITP